MVPTDKDECADGRSYQCWNASTCNNLPYGKGYECVCDEGYKKFEEEGNVIGECICKSPQACGNDSRDGRLDK